MWNFLPRTQRARKAKSGPIKPLFPGYFFARFDPIEHLRNVHYARGVAYIVRCKGVPVHVSPQVMIELRLLSRRYCGDPRPTLNKIGDNIKVISGIFKGDQGIVTKLIPAREHDVAYF